MKILLYDTGDVRNELNEPLGIEIIYTIVKSCRSAIEVDVKWHNKDGLDIEFSDYDIIGVGLNIKSLDKLNHIIKEVENTSTMIIVGNVMATYASEKILDLYSNVFCIVGEGEVSWLKIMENIDCGKAILDDVPNLVSKKKGEILKSRREIMNLKNYIKPTRIFLPYISEQNGLIRLESSRGCAWGKCTFCNVNYKYDNRRRRAISINIVVEQLIELSEKNVRYISFTDEDFLGNEANSVKELIDEISRNIDSGKINRNIKYFISIKPSDLLVEDRIQVIRKFIKIGLNSVFVGFESGSSGQLKRYGKGLTVEKYRICMDEIKKMPIEIDIGFIFSDPKVTISELWENICFIEEFQLNKLSSDMIKMMRLQPYTDMLDSNSELIDGDMDIESISYLYSFKYEIVAKIFKEYNEIISKDKIYQLQNRARGNNNLEISDKKTTEELSNVRNIQFQIFKLIFLKNLEPIVGGQEYYLDEIEKKSDELRGRL